MSLLIVILLVGCHLFQDTAGGVLPGQLRTTNMDASFARWTKGTPVPYCFDTVSPLTDTEKTLVTDSLNTLGNALGNCMTFKKLADCSSSTYKLRFQAVTDGSPSNAFPGIKVATRSSGATDQIVGLARDATNCPSDPRCIMKQGLISLGKRNEHDRGDRNNSIEVNYPNIMPQYTDLYKPYNSTAAYWSSFPYDYCSITHNKMTDYAQPGTMAFTVKKYPYCIPELPTISRTDCLLISRMYSCTSLTACDALPDCATATCPTTTVGTTTAPSTTTAAATTSTSTLSTTSTGTTTTGSTTTTMPSTTTTPSTTSTVTSTTTAMTTTTAPPCIDFCLETTLIDEASKLFNGNYYMFSGDCMVQIDVANKLIGSSVKINTILPGVTGPVKSVWSDQRSITYVRTSTMEYACFAGNCQSISPIPDVDLPLIRWEGSAGVTYSYFANYPVLGAIYFNDLIDEYAYPMSAISCGASACLIDPAKWNAAYTFSFAGLQLTNVIGMDLATGNQRMFMTLMKSDLTSPTTAVAGGIGTGTADDFGSPSVGTPLTPLLGCPNAAAG